MIRLFTGLPGAGKSYGATEDALTELRTGFRVVYHNMEFGHGEMAAYLKRQGYEPDMSVRIVRIPEDRVKDFWDYAKERGDLSGRLFIIDEAHVYFDARGWAESGPKMSKYLTQHRHLNDELLFVSQHPEMLDKRIRLLVASTREFRNLRTEKWLQWFKPPSWMMWAEFYGLPRHGQKPQAIGRQKLNMEVAACYKTSVGHGGMGASGIPEKDRPTRRISWKWLWIPAGAALYLVINGPELLLKWGITSSMKGLSPALPQKSEIVTQASAPRVDPGQPAVTRSTPPATQEPGAVLRVSGYVTDGNGFRILLSDGRVLTEEDGPYRRAGRLHWSTGEWAIMTR